MTPIFYKPKPHYHIKALLAALVLCALFLGDPFGVREVAALVLTLAGVALALQKPSARTSGQA